MIIIDGLEMPNENERLDIVINPNGKVTYSLDLECKQIATAKPVKHGRWIPAQDYSNGNEDIECSNCGEWFKSLELCGRLGEPNYCPVCGTKMEEYKQN